MSKNYVGILETSPESAKIMFVAEREKSVKLGRLYMLMHPGSKVTARIIEGRSFSKYEQLFLQYLFWNTFQSRPVEDYSELIKNIVSESKKLAVTEAEESWLDAQISEFEYKVNITPQGHNYELKETTPPPPRKTKSGEEDGEDKPVKPKRAGTTISIIWD